MHLSDAASLISIVVGVTAVALAVVFYRWPSEKSAAMNAAAGQGARMLNHPDQGR